jgi:hypothetical protein
MASVMLAAPVTHIAARRAGFCMAFGSGFKGGGGRGASENENGSEALHLDS